jgi:hypothetical protein
MIGEIQFGGTLKIVFVNETSVSEASVFCDNLHFKNKGQEFSKFQEARPAPLPERCYSRRKQSWQE